MEDLQSLMSCLDDISSKIPDGIYLEMADKMKRINDHLTGNKPFHEDPFYYSSDEEDSNSDDDSDYVSDSEQVTDTRSAEQARREVRIEIIRDHLLDYVRSMHQTWAEVQKWEKEVKKELPLIKRMSATRKAEAIHAFCRKCYTSGKVEDDSALVGSLSGYNLHEAWTWERLVENGLRVIVMEIGTEEEIVRAKRGFMCYEELSLATIKKLPAFEKKIYDDYKREHNEGFIQNRREANANVREHEELMQKWEMCAREEENKLSALGAHVYDRDRWDAEAHDFWVDDVTGLLVNGP